MKTNQLIKFSIVAAASVMLYTTAFAAGTAKALSDTALAGAGQVSYGNTASPHVNNASGAISQPASVMKEGCKQIGGAWNSATKACALKHSNAGIGLAQPVHGGGVAVPVSTAKTTPSCKGGQYYSSTQKKCVAFGSEKLGNCSRGTVYNGSNCVTEATAYYKCFQGQYYSSAQKKCVNDGSENLGKCSAGTYWDGVKCISSSASKVSISAPLATGPGPVIIGSVGTAHVNNSSDTASFGTAISHTQKVS